MITLKGVLMVILYIAAACRCFHLMQMNYKYYGWRTGKERQIIAWNVIGWFIATVLFVIKLIQYIMRG